MMIEDALFHLHEQVSGQAELSPETIKGTSVVLGLFVEDPDEVAAKAIAAGAIATSPVKDHDYGYRQGNLNDPFGHRWVVQKRI